MATLYPIGYGTLLVPIAEVKRQHSPKMHPEMAPCLWAWLESMDGLIGIGGGWRPTPDPVSPASSQGKSFHQDQRFASGFVGYAAVDLVARNPGRKHRAPTWAESATAPKYGLHTFISGEPWHMQRLGMRGWQSWVDAGRPDPQPFPLPGGDMRLVTPPRRLIDTRKLGGKVQPGQVVEVGTSETGQGVAVNLTVTETEGPGFLAAWGAGNQPATSNVNWWAPGQTVANAADVPLDGNRIRFTVNAPCHVIVDLQGVHP